jgi:hypothetical protein
VRSPSDDRSPRIALNRPLEDGDRPRLFAMAVASIVGGALILSVIGRAPARPAKHVERGAPAPTATPAAPIVLTSPVQVERSGPPSEESGPSGGLEISRTELRTVKRTARGFLLDRRPFTYGRGAARNIRAASARLRAELAAEPPRVPPRERRHRPRVTLLQLDGAGRTWAGVVALVDDGARRDSVALTLARVGRAWQVTRAGD